MSGVDETLEFRDKPDPAHPFAFPSDISTRRIEAEWYHFVKSVPWNTITVGGEYRNEVGEVKGSYEETVDSWAIVLQDQIALFDSCTSPAGVRYDGNSAFEDKATARLARLLSREGHRHAPQGELGGRASAPTFNELFFPAFPPCGPFGNPDLEPEESDGWDAGVGAAPLGPPRAARRDVLPERLREPHPVHADRSGELLLPGAERRQGALRGRRGGGQRGPVDGLVLSLAYTYTDPRTRPRATRSRGSPRTPSR